MAGIASTVERRAGQLPYRLSKCSDATDSNILLIVLLESKGNPRKLNHPKLRI